MSGIFPDRYFYLIVLVAVTTTMVYSFLFLVAPQFHHESGLETLGVFILSVLLVGAFIISAVLISVYVELTFCEKCNVDDLHLMWSLPELLKPLTREGQHTVWMVHFIKDYHFLLFIVVFSFIDGVFACWSPKPGDKPRFLRIFLILDIPLLIAVLLTTWMKVKVPEDEAARFEAGAIAFQLVVGMLVAYMLDARDRLCRLMVASETDIHPQTEPVHNP